MIVTEGESMNSDIERLITRFNQEVGNKGWVSSRGAYLESLREALLATGLDCSAFITDTAMSLKYRIKKNGNRITQIRC